ncbi:flavin reductase family protein [Micromonospora sp. SL1-18]|uniref:flavin reductase family protein n=1 Tax=Micromonospora sp. SL1-18 TaxID=3399128 RepID=UPI003A4D7018
MLRKVFGAFATGVTVVTVGGRAPHGMTANSFASVSLEPPLVLVCVDRDAVMHDRLVAAGSFAVSMLGADQEGVARHFANRWRGSGMAQFDPVDWAPGGRTGAPLISGALAWLECGLWQTYDGGDHSIFVGNLLAIQRRQSQEALLFFGGRFHRLMEGGT